MSIEWNLPVLIERTDLQVRCKDAEQMVVCIKCRGHGLIYHGSKFGDLWSCGWAVYERWSSYCPACDGQAYWRALQ